MYALKCPSHPTDFWLALPRKSFLVFAIIKSSFKMKKGSIRSGLNNIFFIACKTTFVVLAFIISFIQQNVNTRTKPFHDSSAD